MGQLFSNIEEDLAKEFRTLCAKGKLNEAKAWLSQHPCINTVNNVDQAFEMAVLATEFEVARWIESLYPGRYALTIREDNETGIVHAYFNVVHHMSVTPCSLENCVDGTRVSLHESRFVNVDFNTTIIGTEPSGDNRIGRNHLRFARHNLAYSLPKQGGYEEETN